MEILSQIALNQGLTFLAWVTAIVVLVVGAFLVKLLYDLSTLTKNINETTMIVNEELKPTVEEFKQTLHSVNAIVKSTDQSVDNIKSAIGRTLDKTKNISDSIISGIIKGFTTVLKLFKKL